MSNVLFRTNVRIGFILLCFGLIISACDHSSTDLGGNTTVSPVVLVVGEDLSQTFSQNDYLQKKHVEMLCKSMLKYSGGGKIILIGIGNTTPQGHLSCIFSPQQVVNKKNPTPSEKRKNQKINAEIIKDNQEKVTYFLEEVDKILSERNQNYTDINGFFTKASLVLNDPDNDDYSKFLYINSDGKQSTPNSNKVDCNKKPEGLDSFYVSGWTAKTDCEPDSRFLSPNEFVTFFKNKIKSISQD
jgi:hypothetical protein